jgi:hypothetical protein
MNYTVDYIGDGVYGVFQDFNFDKPLMTHSEAAECLHWAYNHSEGKPVLYPPYIKEVILLEMASNHETI